MNAIAAMTILVWALGTYPYWKRTPSRQCQYWYRHLASAHTGNERHHGSAINGMGTDQCPILELNRARTGIGTVFHVDGTMALDQPQRGKDDQHRHQQTTIKKHRNGGAPSALEDGSGMVGRRQKKVVWYGHDNSLTWQRRGDDGAGSTPVRRGRSASTLINNNQQVKQSRLADNTTSNERRRPTI